MTWLEDLEGIVEIYKDGYDPGWALALAMLREAERLPKPQGVCHYCCDCEASLCLHPREKCGWCAWDAKLREVGHIIWCHIAIDAHMAEVEALRSLHDRLSTLTAIHGRKETTVEEFLSYILPIGDQACREREALRPKAEKWEQVERRLPSKERGTLAGHATNCLIWGFDGQGVGLRWPCSCGYYTYYLEEKVEVLRADLFAARDAVLKEGMEADRLRAENERLETRLRMGPDWDGE